MKGERPGQLSIARAGERRGVTDLATLGLVTTGLALLLARIWLPALGSAGRLAALTATMVAILAGSLLVPVAGGRVILRPSLVLAIGLAAIVVALAAGGRPVPAPDAVWSLPLSLLAAVAEEALFRRFAYGALERRGPAIAVGVTALAFALIHVPLYGWAVFPVDLGAGLLLSWQRWASGTWTVPAATHAASNVVMTVLR
jgi:membrane protease YdiL (CAAX protease family)